MDSAPERYARSSIALHWLTVVVLSVTIPLGMSLGRAPPGWGDTLYRLHWSFGLTMLVIAVLRIANRLSSALPEPYAGLTRLERVLSAFVHRALYILIVVVPLLGWAAKSAYGGAISVFGLFDAPAIVAQNEQLSERLLAVHGVAARLLVLCIILHVAGALNHALIKKDGVLRRMLPGG